MTKLGDHQAAEVKTGGRKHAHDPPVLLRRESDGNVKPMRFVSLHHHTTFSYRDGYQLPEAHVRRAAELNMSAIAFTEHGNVSSHVKAEIAAEEIGVKPIYGCELYTGQVGENAQQMKFHLTVLAKNQQGYRNLMSLVSRSWAEGFYYEATVNGKMLREHVKGLVVLSGCQGSLLFCSTVGGKNIAAEEASLARGLGVARWFKDLCGGDYFIEVQAFPELELTCKANPLLAKIASKLGIRLVATMDCHYTALEEREVQMILHNLRGGNKKTIEDQAREWGYDVPLCPPPDDQSIYRRLRETGLTKSQSIEAIVSSEEIAQQCNVKIPKLSPVTFPPKPGFSSAQEIWDSWLKEGWRFRGFHKLPLSEREAARIQLLKEKKVMEDKGFLDYMLIVADAIRFIKDLGMFVGPARGSAAASIVCYLLRITEVNPQRFPNLVFERFIDVTRKDLPDIDIDLPSEARPILRDYVERKYGRNCINNVGTFSGFKGKNSLDDVARVFRVPKWEVDRIKDFLIERSSGDLRASATIEDTIEQFPQVREIFDRHPELLKSQLLEGNYKDFGVHAGGLVISNEPIEEVGVCAVHQREVPKGSGNIIRAIGLDYRDAERQGMNKIDFLGLSTASAINESLQILGMTPNDLYNLPLDDEEVIDVFRTNDVVGIFQMDGRACRYVCGALRPDNIEEICDIVALARPGALHNGAAREYIEIKHSNATPVLRHVLVDEILAPTKFQIVYQEQILRICREVGNFPWSTTSEIRKIIAKKYGEQAFNRKREEFIAGATTISRRADACNMTREAAGNLFGEMTTAGSYSFNFAHSASYGLLAYFTGWFKHYHPSVFYSTSANAMPHRQHDLLRDAGKHRIRVLPAHPTHSEVGWTPIGKRKIRAGFKQISGVGEKVAASIEDYRGREGLESWDALVNIPGIGPVTVDNIKKWSGQPDPFNAFLLDRNIQNVKAEIESGKLPNLPTPTHTAIDLPYEAVSAVAVTWLGTILSRNVRDIFETNRAKKGVELDSSKVRDPHLNEWALLTCEDESDQLLLKIDRWKYLQFKQAIFDFQLGTDLLLVQGVRPRYVTARQIQVKKLWVISPDD